jgi:hypothetical protein
LPCYFDGATALTLGQMQTKYSTLFLLFLLSAFPFASALAQPGDDQKGTAAVSPSLEQLQEKGSEAIFNLEYDVARQRFKEMARLYPDDPTGPQMLATTLWLETLNQARRLQAAIFSTQSFYAGTEDKPDPRVVQDFRDLTRQATQVAKARLQRNRDPQTVLGATESLRASFAADPEQRIASVARISEQHSRRFRLAMRDPPAQHRGSARSAGVIMSLSFYASKSQRNVIALRKSPQGSQRRPAVLKRNQR